MEQKTIAQNIKEIITKKQKRAKNAKEDVITLNLKEVEDVLYVIDEVNEYQIMLDVFDQREYRKKYLEEERAKNPRLLYPDGDEIYRKYFYLKDREKELETLNFIKGQKNLELMMELGKTNAKLNVLADFINKFDIDEEICSKVLCSGEDKKEKECIDCIINTLCN